MLRNRIYYAIKPLVPLARRRAIRRWFALRKRQRVGHVWPILPGSERPPDGWPGWPDGKKFALVLTHDVEGPAGLAKCRQLMELQRDLGFRSCFNFIPEGDYRVTEDLRAELVRNGFEVGVHDLHHDGKLFRSRREFSQNAVRINHYLKEWGAVGFRAGFMLHNLDWIGDLNVQYDLSTFDTDPFEPQPDNVATIFPFWVERRGEQQSNKETKGAGGRNQETGDRSQVSGIRSHSALCTLNSSLPPGPQPSTTAPLATRHSLPATPSEGYLELPYTLPQDSTLYLLFQERHPDIWFQKLDWVARHGGMALVNVHPDYVQFPGQPPSEFTFPAEIYSDFLKYARQRYGDSFWQPTPRELAAWASRFKPARPTQPRRVAMVTYSGYLGDTRVMRYAEALAGRGDHVDVLSLRRVADRPAHEVANGVHIHRLQSRIGKGEKSRSSFLLPTLRFLWLSSWWLLRAHARKPYDLLHIHNLPDFMVFAGWYPRLRGAKIILDIHDIMPELYQNKFGLDERSLGVRSLKLVERASARLAHHVIIANHLWHGKYSRRTGANGNCSVFINNVETGIFYPRPRSRADGKFVLLFPGSLHWHQGLDIAIRAFQKVSTQLPQAQLHIYGDGSAKDDLLKLTRELGLDAGVRFFDPLSVRQIADVMANADLGVVPKRADSFGNEAYSTKIMEFMSLGVPVVASSTKIDRYYFDDSVLRFFESGNPDRLAEAILAVARNKDETRAMVQRASAYAQKHSWEHRKQDYLALVDSLLAGGDSQQRNKETKP